MHSSNSVEEKHSCTQKLNKIRMKSLKFLPVTYRISTIIIIVLAVCAEHSSACNWFKFKSKPNDHNINHKLIKSSNQGTHKKAVPYIKSQQESNNPDNENKENALKFLFEALGKMSKINKPIKSHVGSIQESHNHDATFKEIAWKMVFDALDKMTKTNNLNAVTKENAWKLIREPLDSMAKAFTNYIHWKPGSGNQDATIKEMAWKLISEALEKMLETNIRISPHNAATGYKMK